MPHLRVFVYSTLTHSRGHACYADRTNGDKDAKSYQGTGFPRCVRTPLRNTAHSDSRYQQSLRIHPIGRAGHQRDAVLPRPNQQLGYIIGINYGNTVHAIMKIAVKRMNNEFIAGLHLIKMSE